MIKSKLYDLLKIIFFYIIVKPVIIFIIGLNIFNKNKLPKKGPAIIIANHNSHLDTMVLMSLFSGKAINKIKPVAAQEYFYKNRLLKWFSKNIISIIPIKRTNNNKEEINNKIISSLKKDNIVIFFPEGSRGEPEKMSEFKKGIYHLVANNSQIPVYPVFMQGLGKSLPKDESILVPFVCDIVVGDPVIFSENKEEYLQNINACFDNLKKTIKINVWE